MIIRKRFNIDRSYFITALSYWLFCDPNRSLDCKDSKKVAKKVLKDTVYWFGRGNWHGDLAIHEAIGDDYMNMYNEIHSKITVWVDNNFPNFK